MTHSPEAAMQSMLAGLEAKTGRSIDEWRKVVKKSGLGKHGEIVAFLKKDDGVTDGYATSSPTDPRLRRGLGRRAGGGPRGDAVRAAAKSGLRPISRRGGEPGEAFGKDVERVAQEGLRGALAGRSRSPDPALDRDPGGPGTNLKGVPAKGRLEASGSLRTPAMRTHRDAPRARRT